MADDDIIVLNQPLRSRTSKSGKERFTINVRSEPLIHNLDPSKLGRGPAEAIAEALRAKVKAIGASAAAATLAYRARAAKSFAAGAPWATRRYAGGRIGAMAPNQSSAAFNDSGRFAASLVAAPNPKEHSWTINVAANRLDSSSGAPVRIFRRLVELVPEFANPAKLLEVASVRQSLSDGLREAIVRAEMRRDELSAARAKAIIGAIGSVARALAGLG